MASLSPYLAGVVIHAYPSTRDQALAVDRNIIMIWKENIKSQFLLQSFCKTFALISLDTCYPYFTLFLVGKLNNYME